MPDVTGLFGFGGPLGALYSLYNLNRLMKADNDADRQKYEAEYSQAVADLQALGFDIGAYSPEAMQGYLDAAPELAGLAGADAAVLSAKAVSDLIGGYVANPDAYTDLVVAPETGYTTRQRSQADMQRDVDSGSYVFTNPDGTSYVLDQDGYISKYEVPPNTATAAESAAATAAGGGSPASSTAAENAAAAEAAAGGGGSKAASDAAAGGGSKTAAENAAAAEAAATMPTGGSTTTTTSGNPGGKGVIKDGDWTYNPDTGAWTNNKTGAVTGTLDEGGEAKEHWSNVINDWLKVTPRSKDEIAEAIKNSKVPTAAVNAAGYNMDGTKIGTDGTGTGDTGTGNCNALTEDKVNGKCVGKCLAGQTRNAAGTCEGTGTATTTGTCADPTYAAANPTICGTGKCPDGSPKDAAGNCKGDCPAGQTKDAAGNCKGTGEGKGCNDPVYFAMHLSECAPTPKKPVTPTTQTTMPEQSYQQVTTTPGDLADIKYLYDVGGESIFAPNMSDYANEDDPISYLSPYSSRNTSPYNSYASGGKVSEYDIVTEALRLLRGD